jgi:N,N'-diacetyllegionaminate synthase
MGFQQDKHIKTIIIAEAGVNHNGSIDLAKQLINVAAEAGVDYVKFQTFKADNLVSKSAKKAAYQIANTKDNSSQYDMLKSLELSEANHIELIEYCKKQKVKFFSTAFDLDGLDFLNTLGFDIFKVPSGEITNYSYLKKLAKFGKPVILSTGMSTMQEIRDALDVLTSEQLTKDQITILHCNTEYPTPMEDVNLNAMLHIRDQLGVKVGYSDHTLGIEVPIAAVSLGACVIEKHFTLDRSLPGPDHKASLEPSELKHMVHSIRNIETALGNGIKKPTNSELKNREIARKSLYVTRGLSEGHIIVEEDLTAKRPAKGISPMDMPKLLGRQVIKSIEKDALLSLDYLN